MVTRPLATGLVAVIVAFFATPASGQSLGAEAYLYLQVPVPAEVISDNYIERIILPGLKPELGAVWGSAKDAEQSINVALDDHFSSRESRADAELYQTYQRKLLMLQRLRSALIIREQLTITPESYAARAGQPGFMPTEGREAFMSHAQKFLARGDNPQQATLKAAISWIHDRDRKAGALVRECYFENPRSEWHEFCVMAMMGIDQTYRDATMAEMFPLDERAVAQLLDAQFGKASAELVLRRSSIVDVITLTLLPRCEKGGPRTTSSCWPRADFRRHRETAIVAALANREDYRAAMQQRESQIAQAERAAAAAERATAANGPLAGFLAALTVGAVGMAYIADMKKSQRAAANAANPKWEGHEEDEWCYLEYVTWYPSLRLEVTTYCHNYTGSIRSIRASDGLLGAAVALVSPDPCSRVKGWCTKE